ncbi:hypothetical protein MRBLWO12_003855 [Microbacterium sp. LWO12-1.2]
MVKPIVPIGAAQEDLEHRATGRRDGRLGEGLQEGREVTDDIAGVLDLHSCLGEVCKYVAEEIVAVRPSTIDRRAPDLCAGSKFLVLETVDTALGDDLERRRSQPLRDKSSAPSGAPRTQVINRHEATLSSDAPQRNRELQPPSDISRC